METVRETCLRVLQVDYKELVVNVNTAVMFKNQRDDVFIHMGGWAACSLRSITSEGNDMKSYNDNMAEVIINMVTRWRGL